MHSSQLPLLPKGMSFLPWLFRGTLISLLFPGRELSLLTFASKFSIASSYRPLHSLGASPNTLKNFGSGMTSITGKDNYLDEVLLYLLIVTKVPDFLLFPDSRKVKYCRAMKRREV